MNGEERYFGVAINGGKQRHTSLVDIFFGPGKTQLKSMKVNDGVELA